MNKYLKTLGFTAILLCSSYLSATQTNPFEKLLPYSIESGVAWVNEHVSALNLELQLVYLNFFALSTQAQNGDRKELLQCIQFLNTEKAMLPSSESLFQSIINILNKYREQIEKKIKKNFTEKEKNAIAERLNEKTQELFGLVISIYYQILYNHVAKNNPESLTYMFDENGIIPQEKRTQPLPTSL